MKLNNIANGLAFAAIVNCWIANATTEQWNTNWFKNEDVSNSIVLKVTRALNDFWGDNNRSIQVWTWTAEPHVWLSFANRLSWYLQSVIDIANIPVLTKEYSKNWTPQCSWTVRKMAMNVAWLLFPQWMSAIDSWKKYSNYNSTFLIGVYTSLYEWIDWNIADIILTSKKHKKLWHRALWIKSASWKWYVIDPYYLWWEKIDINEYLSKTWKKVLKVWVYKHSSVYVD